VSAEVVVQLLGLLLGGGLLVKLVWLPTEAANASRDSYEASILRLEADIRRLEERVTSAEARAISAEQLNVLLRERVAVLEAELAQERRT
jgi:hypothetical protein